MTKSYSEWSNREHETMLRMKKDGFKAREIAEALGRSYDAVASRLQQRKVYRRVVVTEERQHARPRITIEKSQVPDLYERGWRFVGFDGEQCVFEMGAHRVPEASQGTPEAA